MRKSLLLIACATLLFGCGEASSQPPNANGKLMSSNPIICNGMNALEVLEQIKTQGADLRRTREAVFYFYGKEERLHPFQQGLERLGFAVRPTRTEPGRIASMNVAVSEEWLRGIMPKLCALATEHNVEYDGWEASIPEAQPKH